MDEQYSLTNLRDIVVPEPPPLWPPAPEVWILFGLLIAGAAVLACQWRRRRRENAYRQAGVALLDRAGTAHEISVILKRVALAGFPREQVASLVGEDWGRFLNRTCTRGDFSPLIHETAESPASDASKKLAALWIKGHRTSRASDAGSGN